MQIMRLTSPHSSFAASPNFLHAGVMKAFTERPGSTKATRAIIPHAKDHNDRKDDRAAKTLRNGHPPAPCVRRLLKNHATLACGIGTMLSAAASLRSYDSKVGITTCAFLA